METSKNARKVLALAGIVGMFAATAANAQATQTPSSWDANHPRRAEVNARLSNQNKRINEKLSDGKITGAQAAQLHHEDHQIHQEEHDMASQNGGHITKAEQHALNHQEDRVSGKIGSGH